MEKGKKHKSETRTDRIQNLFKQLRKKGGEDEFWKEVLKALKPVAAGWLQKNPAQQQHFDTDDLVMIACTRILEQFGKYDSSKGSFLTWAKVLAERQWINVGKSVTQDFKRIETYMQERLSEDVEKLDHLHLVSRKQADDKFKE